jgi:high-affinity iron transporter
MTVNVFAVPVFFVVLRETLEAGIIVSVLLSFLQQTLGGPDKDELTRKALAKQVSLPSSGPPLLPSLVKEQQR